MYIAESTELAKVHRHTSAIPPALHKWINFRDQLININGDYAYFSPIIYAMLQYSKFSPIMLNIMLM